NSGAVRPASESSSLSAVLATTCATFVAARFTVLTSEEGSDLAALGFAAFTGGALAGLTFLAALTGSAFFAAFADGAFFTALAGVAFAFFAAGFAFFAGLAFDLLWAGADFFLAAIVAPSGAATSPRSYAGSP